MNKFYANYSITYKPILYFRVNLKQQFFTTNFNKNLINNKLKNGTNLNKCFI